MQNKIELKSIGELLSANFYIPSYQRGYRWDKQQVKDLLDDLLEFIQKGAIGIYCIQPLVVKKDYEANPCLIEEIHNDEDLASIDAKLSRAKLRWDVIDGQQRLTTIFILLAYLHSDKTYSIEYETRKGNMTSNNSLDHIGSRDFLKQITNTVISLGDKEIPMEEAAERNIDFYHMYIAHDTIQKWFGMHTEFDNKFKAKMLEVLKDKVKFIWYESQEDDAIKVFTRLNIGKIALTDAELIKALFLNNSNFKSEYEAQIKLEQIEIAAEWDKIEYALQKDEFWLFFHDLNYGKPTRIDYIFDLIREDDLFKLRNELGDQYDETIGNDGHVTFRYFYELFHRKGKAISSGWLHKTWLSVKEYYQVFEEWYDDLELYHYVGYLIALGRVTASQLKKHYKGDKNQFLEYLIEEIKDSITECKELDRNYGENGEDKTQCRPLLLLFNIQTVIDQNKEMVNDDKYGLGAFYKFPFHLFKKEGHKKTKKGWEVEHIASNSGDEVTSPENQKVWLASTTEYIRNANKLKDINDFLDDANEHKPFSTIVQELGDMEINPIKGIDKQKIWNYALLDSGTNEEYQNDPFPIKRICVLTKEQGHKAVLSYEKGKGDHGIVIDKSTKAIAFVPPCTKNVFVKAYTDMPKSLAAWSKDDAIAYRNAIYNTLKDFGVTYNKDNEKIEND